MRQGVKGPRPQPIWARALVRLFGRRVLPPWSRILVGFQICNGHEVRFGPGPIVARFRRK
jgi:hypothetical protein